MGRSSRGCLVGVGLAVLLVTCVPTPSSAVRPLPALPITFVVGRIEGRAIVDDAWIDAQVEMANRVYHPHGLAFVRAGRRALLRPAVVRSTADRDALAREAERGVINAFVVEHLGDAADPDDAIGGRHWRARGRQYVIVARECWRDTLAHEIGHFLGHRGHSDVIGNLMSYLRVLPVSRLTDAQASAMRRAARRYLRTGELRAGARGATRSPRRQIV
ncbi:MAG: hypothetical protein IT379_16180 [Deltaproteobacteria bacterium]|nr:hypothetical protein [Deltaproteobacteria bacterium]